MVSASSSSGSGNAPITFGGLASGIDTNSIIDAMIARAKRPITLATAKQTDYKAKQAALLQVKSSLSSLLGTINALASASTFNARLSTVLADTANTGKLEAAASNSATPGTTKIDILGLATATKLGSTGGMGTAIDQALPLDKAGFVTPVTPGTFTIDGTVFTIPAATADSIVSTGSVGAAVVRTVPLATAGLTMAPVSGTMTINGVGVAYDAAVDSMDTLVARINQSAAGVTAAFDSATRTLTLTNSTPGVSPITLADTSGNFLQAMNLVDGLGAKVGPETAGTNMLSLTDIITQINAAPIGVTATIVNDTDGRANLIKLDGGASNVMLGGGGDTSNFLAATNLRATPSGTVRTSAFGIGGTVVTSDLSASRLTTPIAPATGSFVINGVSFSYDAASDSLNNIMTHINTSSAGVTAAYDSLTDRMTLTSRSLGSASITVSDTVGNFLAATRVLGATQAVGVNASYKLDGGATRYATSNTVTDAIAGVTLTFHDVTTTQVTVEIGANTKAPSDSAAAFVDQYNKTTALIRSAMKYDAAGKGANNGVLFGDSGVRVAGTTLRSIVTRQVLGSSGTLRTLNDIGISFGAAGAAVGTTDSLVLDASKLQAALQTNTAGVVTLLTGFTGTASLDAGGTGSLASVTGTPTAATKPGKYTVTSTITGSLSVTFKPDDGSMPIISSSTIAAGGTNTTLIAGVTLTAKAVLVAGTDTITLGATQQGAGLALQSYTDSLTRVGGVMDNRATGLQSTVDDVQKQIDGMNTRIDALQASLVKKYTALEVTMAQLKSQQAALNGMLGQLGMNTSTK